MSPSEGAATSTSASSKSLGLGSPTGRAARRISRLCMGVLPSGSGEVGSALAEERGHALGVLRARPRALVERSHVGVLVEPTGEGALDERLPTGEGHACP